MARAAELTKEVESFVLILSLESITADLRPAVWRRGPFKLHLAFKCAVKVLNRFQQFNLLSAELSSGNMVHRWSENLPVVVSV